ncbi:MAG: hydrogenase [Vicinamibacterales bacterium]
MRADDRLLFWGMVLFLLSLLTGLVLAAGPAVVANPRGVLAGHLEGAMNGMFLLLVGLFIDRLRLSDGQVWACRASLLYGAFANWFFTTLAGIVGTSEATPLAGAGHAASPALELFVTAGLGSVALATLVGVVLLLVGLRRAMHHPVIVEPV